ncbi:MAG: dethiobiotin synthase [Verrucomicrobia bacterium]|nr:dethiobiotin synthase [Verrucomicrobiota bacterium]
MGQIVFITGTDTGVGKTVVACRLARHWRDTGVKVAALKPFCSGGREDAVALHEALGGGLSLDEINPWHFRAPLAPLLSARLEGRRVLLSQATAHVQRVRRNFDIVLVEGAGGLLSPLGEDFNARDLIAAWRAKPVVVCPNRLGAVNQSLLVLAALPPRVRASAQVVLVSQPRPDLSSRTNGELLAEFLGKERIHFLARLKQDDRTRRTTNLSSLARALRART